LSSFSIDGAGQPAGGPNCPGTAPCPEFILVHSPAVPAGGLRLPPGSSSAFLVKYLPIDLGADLGAVKLEFGSGSNAFESVVPLAGSGKRGTQQTDTFTQDFPPMVDMLLVVDNSPAMASRQQAVATNLAAVLQQLAGSGYDWQVAVISADPAEGGLFRSGPTHPEKVLTPSTPNWAAKFGDKVNVGTHGSGAPSCLEMALEALTSPLSGAQNAGFIRNGAALSVLCVTNGSDHSPLMLNDYLNGFWAIKGANRRTMFSFSAVGGFSPTCLGDTGTLASAASQLNGMTASICDPDWERAFRMFTSCWGCGGRTGFFLTSRPDTS
jgi:hypothetical protein